MNSFQIEYKKFKLNEMKPLEILFFLLENGLGPVGPSTIFIAN
jgi:hypothetical protein